jgi:phosphoribosyl-ATP pyrophosphohydrolase
MTMTMTERTILADLMDVIAARKAEPPGAKSYVRSLLDQGVPTLNAKILEEAGEVITSADEPGDAGRAHLVHEVADLVFHCLVLLGYRDIPWSAVEDELRRRFGTSGITEKESRAKS